MAVSDDDHLKKTEKALVNKLSSGRYRKYGRFVLSVLGSIPWVGSVLSASASLSSEIDQDKINELQKLWLQEHQEKIKELGEAIQDILSKFNNFGDELQARIESSQYLTLVRGAFRSWDRAETLEKKQMLKKLIINAGAIKLCPDDLVRLFISWIDQYHETHFAVIKEIYKKPGITRGGIWDQIQGERPRENSAEADLFRYLIRELSMGGVIRQEREVDAYGRFLKRKTNKVRSGDRVMESSFEDTKPYALTELGRQFVHYVTEDVVTQIEE